MPDVSTSDMTCRNESHNDHFDQTHSGTKFENEKEARNHYMYILPPGKQEQCYDASNGTDQPISKEIHSEKIMYEQNTCYQTMCNENTCVNNTCVNTMCVYPGSVTEDYKCVYTADSVTISTADIPIGCKLRTKLQKLCKTNQPLKGKVILTYIPDEVESAEIQEGNGTRNIPDSKPNIGNKDMHDISNVVASENVLTPVQVVDKLEIVSDESGHEQMPIPSGDNSCPVQENIEPGKVLVVRKRKGRKQVNPKRVAMKESLLRKITSSTKAGSKKGKKHSCDICGKVFPSNQGLICHIRTHTGEKPFKCNVCDRAFGDKTTCRRHTSIHTGLRPHKCEECGKTFVQRNSLYSHRKVHGSVKDFKCKICGQEFLWKVSYLNHVGTHSPPVNYEACGKEFLSDMYLQKHYKRVHLCMRPPNKRIVCDVCGKSLASKKTLREHYMQHEGVKPYQCEQCGKDFVKKANLDVHKRVHLEWRPYTCDKCGKGYTTKMGLTSHALGHTGERPYLCDICGKDFVTRGGLQGHRKVHSGEKPFECHICGSRFNSVTKKTRHLVSHTDDRPVACEICDKRFRNRPQMRLHMRIHYDERNYECDVCGRKFKQSSHLQRHRKIHSGEKPYSCNICGKSFNQKSNCDTHIKRQHATSPPLNPYERLG
ncbi:zinc finger protein 260-like [Mizuhopecten yessoensis]|uniref:C2H2-type domain-containing protein n=1 Tax=Mizuhopecten yessoensis TaxID=6573 RepID=A0A210R6X7_MIZYE|nr:zinc finger protein 260-like [Mizuhopecten yessoensis]OWF56809.1 hypothetical protein KP79_PYT16042 [Mizuhopecten yessoensis]